MRQVAIYIETTGAFPQEDQRIVEIAAIELVDGKPTGEFYHQYINPQMKISLELSEITGLTEDFLKSYPIFKEVIRDFFDFIKDSTLIVHMARYDIKFLNFELTRNGFERLSANKIIDTKQIAEDKLCGQRTSLDSLLQHFNISLDDEHSIIRVSDCHKIAKVYQKLIEEKC